MKEGEKMRVEEAAKKLGMSTQTLRLALQQEKMPFGTAILTTSASDSKVGKDRFTYYINEKKLEKYLEGSDYEAVSKGV